MENDIKPSLSCAATDEETPPSLGCPTADEDTSVMIIELRIFFVRFVKTRQKLKKYRAKLKHMSSVDDREPTQAQIYDYSIYNYKDGVKMKNEALKQLEALIRYNASQILERLQSNSTLVIRAIRVTNQLDGFLVDSAGLLQDLS